MKTFLRFLPFFLGFGLLAQTPGPTPRDVVQTATFGTCSTTGGTPIFVGLNPGIRWRLTFYVDGTNFTAASVGIQGAPTSGASSTSPGTPGSWTSTTAITLIEGSASPLVNPIASAAQGTIVIGTYYPWIRALCNSVTGSAGTVFYTLIGYVGTSASEPATGGGGTTPTTVQSLCQTPSVLSTPAVFNLSGSGNTSIITGTAGKSIILCHLSFATTAAEDVKLTDGTTGGSANCGTGTADATGLYKSITAAALDFQGSFKFPVGTDACINQSGSQALGGTATFYIQ